MCGPDGRIDGRGKASKVELVERIWCFGEPGIRDEAEASAEAATEGTCQTVGGLVSDLLADPEFG